MNARMRTGWLCPRCERINAPSSPWCDCKPSAKEKAPVELSNIRWFLDGIPIEELGRADAYGTYTVPDHNMIPRK